MGPKRAALVGIWGGHKKACRRGGENRAFESSWGSDVAVRGRRMLEKCLKKENSWSEGKARFSLICEKARTKGRILVWEGGKVFFCTLEEEREVKKKRTGHSGRETGKPKLLRRNRRRRACLRCQSLIGEKEDSGLEMRRILFLTGNGQSIWRKEK